ncbi:MAG: JAB domain-containing protein [Alphaproteobacteria bacterium]|nr:JAB domain-containing protein [Alphaproteobacteria bacterium]
MTEPPDPDRPEPAPDHLGHRQRLRDRFLSVGGEKMPDYELLELVLMMAIPRVDVKPLAKKLIREFGSFAGVISAPAEALMRVKGVKETTLAALKVVEAGAVRLAKAEVSEKPLIGSWNALLDYCRAIMARSQIEQFRVLFLDRKNRLIADEVQQTGTVDHTPVYPREILKRALEHGASALILVHNHPSGDPTPSRADIEITREVQKAAQALGVQVHDHLIIGRSGHTSFKSQGLL